MPSVKAAAPSSLHGRLGMALALLALLAQFWMGQVSSAHMARMLTAPALAGDICTVQDGPALPDAGATGHPAAQALLNCPVCAVATASSALGSSATRQATLAHQPSTAFRHVPATPRALRHASLYPPAHAPPRA